MNCKSYFIYVMLLLTSGLCAQVQSEDFNHNSQTVSEGDCWEFDDVSIGSSSSINSGTNAPQAQANINGLLTDAELVSPFIQFNGSGTITFKHKMANDEWYYASSSLRLYLRDVSGNVTGPYFTHVYRQISFTNSRPNGTPTAVRTANVPVTWSGYYQVMWYWAGAGSYTSALLDDVVIPKDTTSFHQYDTTCVQEINVLHEPLTSTNAGNFNYLWNWVGVSGGSLTATTTNNRRAQVDWTAGVGNYTLCAKEFYNGSCTGRKTYIHVHVLDRATISATIDSVCTTQSSMVQLHIYGDAPYVINYRVDGGTAQTLTTSNPNTTLALPLGAALFEVISLNDAGSCDGLITAPASQSVKYYVAPASGPVYHY